MQLAVSDLYTTLSQGFTNNTQQKKQIECIRPYLYIHNKPSGTFYFDILSGVTTIYTASFTSSDLYTALGTSDLYAHLFYKLDFGKEVYLDPGAYTFKLRHSGYTASPTSFLAWVHMHDDPINDYTYSPIADNNLPLTVEIYEKRFMP